MKRAIVLFAALALTACGNDAAPSTVAGVPEVIDVSMTDMAYTPAALTVSAGQPVVLRFRNDGAVKHEAVLGSLAEQDEHHVEMAAAAGGDNGSDGHGMDHNMSDLHAVVVEPGETVEMTHVFEAPGQIMLGCHEKGHWEAGMKMTVDVTA